MLVQATLSMQGFENDYSSMYIQTRGNRGPLSHAIRLDRLSGAPELKCTTTCRSMTLRGQSQSMLYTGRCSSILWRSEGTTAAQNNYARVIIRIDELMCGAHRQQRLRSQSVRQKPFTNLPATTPLTANSLALSTGIGAPSSTTCSITPSAHSAPYLPS
jgi:hypothetical protein